MPDYDNGAYFEDISDHISNKIGGIYFLEPGALTPLTEMAPFFPEDVSIGLLHNITIGALKRFEYEDETGVVYTVRCIDNTLKYPMKYWLKHIITVNLYVEGQVLP